MFDVLCQSKTFQGIDKELLEEYFNDIHFQIKKYHAGDMMYQAGTGINDLLILIKGKVSTEMLSYSGKSILISKMKAPDPIADAIAFSKEKRIPVNVEAIEEVELLVIPKEELMKLFYKEPLILENYIGSLADRAVKLTKKINLLSLKTIKGKIAMYLMRASKGQAEFEIRHSQKELAELFGIARPSFARELGTLVEEGIIEVNRRNIKILNLKALRELVE